MVLAFGTIFLTFSSIKRWIAYLTEKERLKADHNSLVLEFFNENVDEVFLLFRKLLTEGIKRTVETTVMVPNEPKKVQQKSLKETYPKPTKQVIMMLLAALRARNYSFATIEDLETIIEWCENLEYYEPLGELNGELSKKQNNG
jgi:hypothetical protein